MLLGEPGTAGLQAFLETSTFAWGYGLSKLDTFTLDGSPVEYPLPSVDFGTTRKFSRVGTRKDSRGACTRYETTSRLVSGSKFDSTPVSAYKPSAAQAASMEGGQGIDERDLRELFLDPFHGSTLASAWVWAPIEATLGYAFLTTGSNAGVLLDQIGVYPVGSGAPEEMFYRGFIQNEAYELVPSPVFSIGLSSLAFGFSHSREERLGAGLTGLYPGYLVHQDHGNLSEAIAPCISGRFSSWAWRAFC